MFYLRYLPTFGAAALAALLCGCGTVTARGHEPIGPYCGLGYDMERLTNGDEWLDWSLQGQSGNVPFFLPRGLLWVLDTLLSFTADTLLLPVDALRPNSPDTEEQ